MASLEVFCESDVGKLPLWGRVVCGVVGHAFRAIRLVLFILSPACFCFLAALLDSRCELSSRILLCIHRHPERCRGSSGICCIVKVLHRFDITVVQVNGINFV